MLKLKSKIIYLSLGIIIGVAIFALMAFFNPSKSENEIVQDKEQPIYYLSDGTLIYKLKDPWNGRQIYVASNPKGGISMTAFLP
ncbi:MAG: hypothetical protein U0T33_00395 [Bacteroidales bacterium]